MEILEVSQICVYVAMLNDLRHSPLEWRMQAIVSCLTCMDARSPLFIISQVCTVEHSDFHIYFNPTT